MAEGSGKGPAKGASGSSELNPGDFASLKAALTQHPGCTARELVVHLTGNANGPFDKKRINAILYRMENAGIARRELRGDTPHWFNS